MAKRSISNHGISHRKIPVDERKFRSLAEEARRMFMEIGDEEEVAWIDAVKEANDAGLSVYACAAAGSTASAIFRGMSMVQWQAAYAKENRSNLNWLLPAIEELRRADLLPWIRFSWAKSGVSRPKALPKTVLTLAASPKGERDVSDY